MAKNPDPARPAGPPPAGAPSRPRPAPAQRPAAPTRPAAGGKMWTPGDKEPPVSAGGAPNAAAPGKPGGENLRMVPLSEDDPGPSTGEHSSTSFFALPAPKRPPAGDPDEPIQPLRRNDPIGAAAAPAAPAPRGAPPGAYPPAGVVPMTPMQPMVAPSPMVPLGIQGPIASGPVYGAGMPHSAQLPPDLQQDVQRAQSYRVFALVAGLMFMVLSAVIVTVILTVGIVLYNQPKGPTGGEVAVIAPPPPPPASTVDTGVARTPLPPPSKAAPAPKPSGPKPAPSAPRPAPPPPPSADPAQATITLGPGAPPFTAVEVKCPGGFRERGDFVGGTARVPAVPREECDVFFKGGPPSKAKISGGQTKTCSFSGVAANCQ